MADFDFDFGSDPFGGGSEGLPQFGAGPSFGDVAQTIPSSDFAGAFGVSPRLNMGSQELPSSPAAPDQKAAPSGFDQIAGQLGGFAKSALPFAQLGSAGLGIGLGIKGSQQQAEQTKIARGAEKRQEQIAGKAQEMAQPLSEFSRQQLTQAGAGKIDPAQEALIQNWLQGAKQKVMDFFARSGQGDSLQLKNELAWLDQMADGMRMQAITAEEQAGIGAAGTAGGILGTGASAAGGAGQAAQQQGGNIQNLIAEANRALGTLAGGSAG